MKNIPEKIFLQVDADGELPEDFNECHEVSWCADKIYDTDLVYCSLKHLKQKIDSHIKWCEENIENLTIRDSPVQTAININPYLGFIRLLKQLK